MAGRDVVTFPGEPYALATRTLDSAEALDVDWSRNRAAIDPTTYQQWVAWLMRFKAWYRKDRNALEWNTKATGDTTQAYADDLDTWRAEYKRQTGRAPTAPAGQVRADYEPSQWGGLASGALAVLGLFAVGYILSSARGRR